MWRCSPRRSAADNTYRLSCLQGPCGREEGGGHFSEFKLLFVALPAPSQALSNGGMRCPRTPLAESSADLNKDARDSAYRLQNGVGRSNQLGLKCGDEISQYAAGKVHNFGGPCEGVFENSALRPQEIRAAARRPAETSSPSNLKKLGVTAIELLPVHHFVNDEHFGREKAYQTLGAATKSTSHLFTFHFLPAAALAIKTNGFFKR